MCINPRHHRFLCFRWQNKVYQWLVLPFGVKSTPYIFSKHIREVVNYFRACDIRCTAWVDDFVFMLHRFSVQDKWAFVHNTLCSLGWDLNYDKCDLTFSTSTQFVGFVLHSEGEFGPWLEVPKKKIAKLQRNLQHVLRVFSDSQGTGAHGQSVHQPYTGSGTRKTSAPQCLQKHLSKTGLGQSCFADTGSTSRFRVVADGPSKLEWGSSLGAASRPSQHSQHSFLLTISHSLSL